MALAPEAFAGPHVQEATEKADELPADSEILRA